MTRLCWISSKSILAALNHILISMQEVKDEPSVLQLTILDPNGVSHSVHISPTELLSEVKACFQEYAPTCYFTECDFRLADQTLSLYEPIGEQNVQPGATLSMVIEDYTERGVRLHVEKLKSVLALPPPNASYIIDADSQAEEQLQVPASTSIPPLTGEEFLPDPSGLPNPTSLLHPYKAEDEVWTRTKCLHQIAFSQFNPPKGRRYLQGDVSYLQVHILEGSIVYITAHTQGFFVNSTRVDEQGLLQHSAEPAETPCRSKTLVGLLEQASPLFKDRFAALLKTASEWETLRYVKSNAEVQPWVSEEKQVEVDTRLDNLRDWNEELQQIQSLVGTTFMQRIQRDKHLAQVYAEFVDAAIAGARAVIAGAFQALNPNDSKTQQVYVFNNIFFSFTEDNEYKQEAGPEACATYISVNHDIRGIKIFNSMDIPGLHTIATAVVDFRGFRVLCQSILPGILSQSPETSAKYGSMDDGQTISSDPDFHALVTAVGDRLHLSPSTLLDKDDHPHTLAGGYDLKGMIGSDKRKYLLENSRITPRDANKLGQEYALCLLRPELVEHYQQLHRRGFIDARVEELREAKKAAFPEDAEKAKITVEEIKEAIAGAPSFLFNPNVFTNARFEDRTKMEEEEKRVKELSEFLVKVQIPMAAKVMSSEENFWPRLGTSIVDVLHQFGVNARYLGAISREITSPEFRFLKYQCEITAVSRAVKHIFNRHLRDTPDHLLAVVITHLLNCVFNLPKRAETSEETKEGKKKRKKKAKKPQTAQSPLPAFPLLSLTREEVWGEVVAYTQRHFDLAIPSRIEDWDSVKLPSFRTFLLREICLQTGIQLAPSSLIDKFTTDSVSGLTHRVKAPDFKSLESKWLYDAAVRAIGEKNNQLAIEMMMQSAGVQASISGPVHKDIASCYQHISNIYFAEGDIQHAVMYQHRAIVLYERALGLDHPVVAQSYVSFAYLYQTAGRVDRSFKHILRACELFALNGCEDCTDAVNGLSSLAMLYADANMYEMAIAVLGRMLDLYSNMFGDQHVRVADCCQVLAFQYKNIKDYDKAVELQTRALDTFKRVLPADDPRIKSAQAMLEAFAKHSGDLQEEGGKEARTNKSVKTDRNAMLRQRLHMRKLQAKMNVPRSRTQQMSPQFMQDLSLYFTQEQIEEEKTRLLIEEIKQKNARR